MPKLLNVTDAEIHDLVNAASDLSQTIADAAHRMGSGYADQIHDMASSVRLLNSLVHSVSELNGVLLAKIALEEQRRELEALHAKSVQPVTEG